MCLNYLIFFKHTPHLITHYACTDSLAVTRRLVLPITSNTSLRFNIPHTPRWPLNF